MSMRLQVFTLSRIRAQFVIGSSFYLCKMTGGVFKQIGEHVRCMISSLINLILYVMLSIVKGTTEGSNGPL